MSEPQEKAMWADSYGGDDDEGNAQFAAVRALFPENEDAWDGGAHDWHEAFKYATQAVAWVLPERAEETEPAGFTSLDVAEVIASVPGDNEGPDWAALMRLKDGTFATLTAGCDYTGWGCQEGGDARRSRTQEGAVRFGLNANSRKRLGLALPDDPPDPPAWGEDVP